MTTQHQEHLGFGTIHDPLIKEKIFQLRYQVYVTEFGFEKKQDHPNGLESDGHDHRALHFGCTTRSGKVVGCLRLVPDLGAGLPMEAAVCVPIPNRETAAEISRLAVAPGFRNGSHGPGGTDVVLGLYRAMYQESKRRGITHLYMITEDWIHGTLTRYGFRFTPIGDPVYYHGWRTPYVGKISKIEAHLAAHHPGTLALLLQGLPKQLHPVPRKKAS